jgi:hypothetical protein
MNFRVFDDRTNKTLFESDSRYECTNFMDKLWQTHSLDEYSHFWLEDVSKRTIEG